MKRVIIRTLQIMLPLVVLAAAAFGALTMVRNRPPVETQTPVFEPPGVRVHEVQLREVPMSVSSQGTVRPRTESQLIPEIAGRITWVSPSFAEGGFFEAGDVLVKIDPFDYEQALVSARSQLAQARLQLAQEEAEAEVAEREWNDLGRGDPRELTLRKPQLDDARASVAAAEANVTRAERDLERADIVAPYAGRIRQKNVDIGQFVRIGDAVATVYSVDVAEVRLPLPDDQIAYLDLPLSYRGGDRQPQPTVTLRATFAGETHEWQGRIVRTESEIDPVSRMVHVVAEVRDPYAASANPNQPPLAVGMYVEAEIQGRTAQNIALVPRAALRGRQQVLVVSRDERISFRDIDVFRATTDAVFVRGGLDEGELVVISPLDTPTDGMQVQFADLDPDVLARIQSSPVDTPTRPTDTSAIASPATTILPDETPSFATADANSDAEATSPVSRPAWLDSLTAENTRERSVRDTRIRPSDPPAADASTEQNTAEPATREAPASTVDTAVTEANESSTVAEVAATPIPMPPATTEATERLVPQNAITVLTFANLNPTTDNMEFGAALGRAITTRLRESDNLALASEQADARYVVSGGIQTVGPSVRVTARIVDSASSAVLHALKVDGAIEDRVKVQSEVAEAVYKHVLLLDNQSETTRTSNVQTLAIRPFEQLNGPADNDRTTNINLGDASTSAVTAQLANLSSVAIVDAETRASLIIGGGIQRIGDVVRVTAQLIETASNSVIRAFKVDGTATDLAELQEQLAAAVAESVTQTIANNLVTTRTENSVSTISHRSQP